MDAIITISTPDQVLYSATRAVRDKAELLDALDTSLAKAETHNGSPLFQCTINVVLD